jgi:SPP1 gp7 family putative phage head morphogenesis protein
MLAAIARTQDATVVTEVARGLERGSVAAAMAGIDWSVLEGELETFRPAVRNLAEQAGIEIAREVADDLRVGFSFNILNEDTVDFIREHTGELITRISQESQDAIRQVLFNAYQEGDSPFRAARQIREYIGLTEPQAMANMRYHRRLLEQGFTQTRADELARQYAARQHRYRAAVIARTETMEAVNVGQRQAWVQAKEAGVLSDIDFQVEWIVTPDDRLCPICEPMDGARREIDGDYPGGQKAPPTHPQCRCTESVVPRRR